jgi:hypothetical protein
MPLRSTQSQLSSGRADSSARNQNADGCLLDEGQIIGRELVVAGRHTPTLPDLELFEQVRHFRDHPPTGRAADMPNSDPFSDCRRLILL